jgi:hypothetical protein
MDWQSERRKLQVKSDRGHFVAAASVVAAIGIAFALLFDALRPGVSVMIYLQTIGVVVFMVIGVSGAYLACAAAMRWPPFNPRKRNIDLYDKVKKLYLDGLLLQSEWGEQTLFMQVHQNTGILRNEDIAARDSEFEERLIQIIAWRDRANQSVVDWFGESACRTFLIEPEISSTPPDWQRGDLWFTNWSQLAGRLIWLQRWLFEQEDL